MSELLFTDTVTIYNRYGDTWKRTVLEGVQWKEKYEHAIADNGALQVARYVSVTVPFRSGYVPAKNYQGDGFTFGLGNQDFIIYGDVPELITGSKSLSDLRKKCDVLTVCAVADNTNRANLKHWRVTAK